MASAPSNAAKPVNVNERTYQEVEYLKKNLGPILVAALAEICIRRPADPIEYLGHWLLRWRYNEELKRRDVQNALDVVRQKQWAQAQEEGKPELFSQGVTPGHPYGPPGYGGPFNPEDLGEVAEQEVPETNFNGNEEAGEAEELDGEAGQLEGYLQGPGEFAEGEIPDERKVSLGEERKVSVGPDGQPRKVSGAPDAALVDGQPRKTSQGPVPPEGERKVSVGPAAAPAVDGERKTSLPPVPEARKPSTGPEAAPPGEVRKTSVGPPAGAPEVRKASGGSTGGAPPALGDEARKTSVGPVAGAEGRKPSIGSVRKASLPSAAGEARKASGGAPPAGEARKASGGEVRKTSLPPSDRKASTGSNGKPPA